MLHENSSVHTSTNGTFFPILHEKADRDSCRSISNKFYIFIKNFQAYYKISIISKLKINQTNQLSNRKLYNQRIIFIFIYKGMPCKLFVQCYPVAIFSQSNTILNVKATFTSNDILIVRVHYFQDQLCGLSFYDVVYFYN